MIIETLTVPCLIVVRIHLIDRSIDWLIDTDAINPAIGQLID